MVLKKIIKFFVNVFMLILPIIFALMIITGSWEAFVSLEFWLAVVIMGVPILIYFSWIYTPYRYLPVLKKYCDKKELIKYIKSDDLKNREKKSQVVIGNNWLVVRRRYINTNFLEAYNIFAMRSPRYRHTNYTFIYKTGEVVEVDDCQYLPKELEKTMDDFFESKNIKKYDGEMKGEKFEKFVNSCAKMTDKQAQEFFEKIAQ